MTMTTAPASRLPEPLADGADTAQRPAGPCHLCGRGILRGQRYAQLVPSGLLAHVVCITRAAGTAARRAA